MPKEHHDQNGFTLLESMVATAIFSFAFMALSSLFIVSSQRFNNNAEYIRASIHLSDGAERVVSFRHELKTNTSPPTGFTENINAWQSNISQSLPQGRGQATCDFQNTELKCALSIQWQTGTQQHEISRTLVL